MTLNRKIYLAVAPLVVLPMLAAGWIAHRQIQVAAMERATSELTTVLDQMKRRMDNSVRTVEANVTLFANASMLQQYLLSDEFERYTLMQGPLLRQFASYQAAYPEYMEIRVIQTNGYEDARATVGDIPNENEEEGESPFFRDMTADPNDIHSGIYSNRDTSGLTLIVSRRIRLTDPRLEPATAVPRVRGYLVVTLDMNFLRQWIREARVGKKGGICLLTPDGQVLKSCESTAPGRPPRASDMMAILESAAGDQTRVNTIQGLPTLFQTRRVSPGMILLGHLPQAEVLDAGRQVRRMLFLSVGFTLLAVLMLLHVLLRAMVLRPLRELRLSAREIGSGRLAHVSVKSRDEMGDLATAFNEMGERLTQARESIEAQNRSLEKTVMERTHAIQEREERLRWQNNALRENEERTKTILNSVQAGILVVDVETKAILDVNPEALNMAGRLREEVIGKECHRFVCPAERGRCPICDLGGTVDNSERKLLRADGTLLPILKTVVPIILGGRKVLLESFVDISERKRAQEELLVAKERAEETSKAKSQFLANMSHEIRTPMNGVLGMAELLVETELTDRQKKFAQAIRSSGEHLLKIINDILDFSRIESGRIELETLNFDMRQALEQTVDLFAEQTARKNIELVLDLPPSLPVAVRGDTSRLRQVLMNLVGNAIKFTEKGEVVLRVRSEAPSDGKAMFRFEVADTGIGIPPEQQTQLFEAFTQADTSTTRRFGGSGLGLAISKQLIQFMGGQIGLTSVVGQGTTFSFSIPLALQPEPAAGTMTPKKALQGLRALIVDDNATNRQILINQVLSWGMRSDAVDSTDTALSQVRQAVASRDPYRVGILDLHMPGKDGLILTRELKADSAIPLFPLIMLTSGDSEHTMREAISLGINQYVRKPIRQSDLYECLLEVLGFRAGSRMTHAKPASIQPAFDARVLMAEDNDINQDVARGMFEHLGCRLEVVDNGRRAVERAMAERFDVVFMDCQMPGMDGYEATREIRRLEDLRNDARHVPIVALTAHALQGDREKCLAAGMDDYISKPLTLDQLQAILARRLTPSQVSTPNAEVVLNSDALLERCLGNPKLVRRLIGKFREQAQADMKTILDAIETGAFEPLAEVAHSLKGAAASMGAESINAKAAAIERMARDKNFKDDGAVIALQEAVRQFLEATATEDNCVVVDPGACIETTT